MARDYIDSAKAAAEADRIIAAARQNLKQVFLSLRNCLQVVHNTQQMLEVDPKCICMNFNAWESRWKERRELQEAAISIENLFFRLLDDSSLIEIETRLAESDDTLVQPKHPGNGGDDNLLWCDRVCVHEKVDMDSALWCTTPPTILELVFARLPLHQIFQLRGLSKHWRALIMSPSFQDVFGTITSRRIALVVGPQGQGIWSFGIREKKWYTLFLFLPNKCNLPIAGDGGLLCCRRQGPIKRTKDLYVCNPLTQAWRKLPLPSQVLGFDHVHLVTSRQTQQHTITVVRDLQQSEHHSGNGKAVVEVYNSATNMWNASNGVFQSGGNNLFYYKKYVEEKFIGVRAYDKTTGYSTSIPLQDLQYSVVSEMEGFFPLAQHQGQIYVLHTEAATSGVWVLHSPSHVWKKLYSVPKPEALKYYLFSLFVSADTIIIFGQNREPVLNDDVDDDNMDIGYDLDPEEPTDSYFWMLNRAEETWIDMTEFKINYPWSQIMFEMRVDGIP